MKRKRTFFCIWTYWMTFLLAVMPSCIYDEEPADTEAHIVPLNMGITIRVPGTDPSARGAEHDKEAEAGTDLENAIDVSNGDIRIYLYKNAKGENNTADFKQSTYLGEVSIFSIQANPKGNYILLGRVNADSDDIAEMNTNGFRVVVMANLAKWYGSESSNDKGYPTPAKEKSFQTSDFFSYEYGNTTYSGYGYCVSSDKLIPMWGIHTYEGEGIQLKPDEMLFLEEPIDMLRAFAKIEVINETQDTNLQLTEVSLTGHHTRFYIQPAASGYTDGNTNADFTDCNVPENGTNTDTALKFTEDSESMNKFILYVPEMNPDSEKSKITVTFTDVKNNNTTSEFFINNSEKVTSLLRNHIYRFKVSLKKGTLSIYYQGIPWEEKDEIKIESGCDYDYNS